MVISAGDGGVQKMEGWLHLVRSNRLGLQYSRKRYFILDGNTVNCYKDVPASNKEDPVRSGLINSCTRVTDNGRESINRNVFYMFTLYSTSNPNDRFKLGARSSEEAARWIKSLMEAAFMFQEIPNKEENLVACSNKRSCRGNEKRRLNSIDWTVFSSVNVDPITSDVIAPSMWTIIGCRNGLRFFKEAKDFDFPTKDWIDHPAIMAVGVVDASSEAIFQTVMSLGQSRSEWDFCLLDGEVVEHLDGHTDIIHKKLRGDWFPWGMKRRDLLLSRYWRREDDGTYGGGYEISPVNDGKQSVVKHMLAIDWKTWNSCLFSSSTMYVTMRMLARVAALREFFRAKLGDSGCLDITSDYLTRAIELQQMKKAQIKLQMQVADENSRSANFVEDSQKSPPSHMGDGSLQLNDAVDEFFDVLAESESDQTDKFWPSDETMPLVNQVQDQCHNKLSTTAAGFIKKLHNIAVQKSGYSDLEEASNMPYSYGTTLTKDTNCSMTCSWATADPSTFLIRGKSYLHDRQKVKADSTLMQMVAADWLKSDKREDDLGGRRGGIVQKYAAQGGSEFFFIVHLQVPGSTAYSLALYYMLDTPLGNVPLLESFVEGDDAYRNSRFKLIPYISTGSWIVKQSVGKKAGLVGQALDINYFRGSNYIELDVDVGSSTVAKGVVSLVISYLSTLVIEMAFLIQSNTQEELPEALLGTCRLSHLDISKAVSVNNWPKFLPLKKCFIISTHFMLKFCFQQLLPKIWNFSNTNNERQQCDCDLNLSPSSAPPTASQPANQPANLCDPAHVEQPPPVKVEEAPI